MTEWQPIETAPEDETEFLAYDVRTKKFDVCEIYRGNVISTQFDGEQGPDEHEFGYYREDIKWWIPLPAPPPLVIESTRYVRPLDLAGSEKA